MPPRKAAPKADYTKQADTQHVIADAGAAAADLDLLAIIGKPQFAPQRLILINTNAAATAAIVLTPEKGADITVTVPFSGTVTLDVPIKKIEDTGTGAVQVICLWWDGAGTMSWNFEDPA
jgi:hypothetical protein